MKSKMMCVMAAAAILSGSVMAQIVYSTNFNDNSVDGWYVVNKDAFNSIDGSAGYLRLSDTDTTDNVFSAVASFTAVNMLQLGTKIALTCDFQNFESQPQYRGLCIGLYDSAGTPFTADSADQGTTGDDSGWYMYTRRNPAMHRLYENNSQGVLSTSGAARATSSPAVTTFGIADGKWHTFKLEIEVVADLPGDSYDDAGDYGLDHLVTMICDEGLATQQVLTYRDLSGLISNLDEISIMSMKGLDVGIDNVVVTAVPEPATLLLLGIGGMIWCRRK